MLATIVKITSLPRYILARNSNNLLQEHASCVTKYHPFSLLLLQLKEHTLTSLQRRNLRIESLSLLLIRKPHIRGNGRFIIRLRLEGDDFRQAQTRQVKFLISFCDLSVEVNKTLLKRVVVSTR